MVDYGIFCAARGPGYLVMLLALVVIFALERTVKIVAYFMGRHKERKQKRNEGL